MIVPRLTIRNEGDLRSLEQEPYSYIPALLLKNKKPRVKLIEDPDFTLHGDIRENTIELHIFLYRWNHRVYEKLLHVAHVMKTDLPKYGIHWLIVVLKAKDYKTRKFESMLGFDVWKESKTHVIMKQKCYLRWEDVI